MSISHSLLPEFDQEMANTRKTLERLPEGKWDYKPHEKSMAMGRLAMHLAEMPGWIVPTIRQDSLDIQPPGAPKWVGKMASSTAEVLAEFDKNVNAAREAMAGCSDADWVKPWSLLVTGKVMFTLPKIGVVRSMILNHAIHHRAQLGVYLRLNDLPVPSVYGPSADEGQSG
jgi:uncharacterized damage-inducible protein DinB